MRLSQFLYFKTLFFNFSETFNPFQLFDSFTFNQELIFIFPEVSFITALTLIILIVTMQTTQTAINLIFNNLYILTIYGVGINLCYLLEIILNVGFEESLLIFNNILLINTSGLLFKIFISLFFFVYLLIFDEFSENDTGSDILILQLLISQFILFFCYCLLLSANLFVTFVCLESITFSICSLLVITKNLPQVSEVIVKYFLFNVTTTSILMYGFSEIFRITQSLNYWDIHYFFLTNTDKTEFLSFWIIFCITTVVGSFLFKLNVAPFHFWSIEVYGHMQISTLLLILFPIKISLFLNFTLLLNSAFALLSSFWKPVLFILGILSVGFGTIGALYQDQLKQFFVYSSVVQTGLLILGLSTNTIYGISAAVLHLFSYSITGLGIFIFLVRFLVLDLNSNITYLNQLNKIKTHPLTKAFGFYGLIFSFAGLPPFFGFFTKFNLLITLFAAGYTFTTFFILICNIISVIYYLNILRDSFFVDDTVDLFKPTTPAQVYNANLVSPLRHIFYVIVCSVVLFSVEINSCIKVFKLLVENWIFFLY